MWQGLKQTESNSLDFLRGSNKKLIKIEKSKNNMHKQIFERKTENNITIENAGQEQTVWNTHKKVVKSIVWELEHFFEKKKAWTIVLEMKS